MICMYWFLLNCFWMLIGMSVKFGICLVLFLMVIWICDVLWCCKFGKVICCVKIIWCVLLNFCCLSWLKLNRIWRWKFWFLNWKSGGWSVVLKMRILCFLILVWIICWCMGFFVLFCNLMVKRLLIVY